MRRIIIAIECEDYFDAKEALEKWVNHVKKEEPWTINKVDRFALFMDMDNMFRYVFFDYRLEDVIGSLADQIFYKDDFFLLEGVGAQSLFEGGYT